MKNRSDLALPITSKHATDAYRDGWDKIFNKKVKESGRKEKESQKKL